MKSKITGGDTTLLFTETVLNKYPVKYFRCNDTGFIQTEEPHWLNEAYNSAITQLDIGLPYRNIMLSDKISRILVRSFNYGAKFLDYAGGYGLFTRLMRDKGFDFYNTDKFCANMFAEHFDLSDLPLNTGFEAITAFEVFEHLANPLAEINEMLNFSANLIFSTELQPANIKSVNDWWYFAVETGQHIAFYTEAALAYIAKELGYYFYTDKQSLHILSKTKFDHNPLLFPKENFVLRKARKFVNKSDEKTTGNLPGLLNADHDYIKAKLKGNL